MAKQPTIKGRPIQTNYKELNYKLLVNGRSYNVMCLFCSRVLKNVARDRLLDHRKKCGVNNTRRPRRVRLNKWVTDETKKGGSDDKAVDEIKDDLNSVNVVFLLLATHCQLDNIWLRPCGSFESPSTFSYFIWKYKVHFLMSFNRIEP